MINYQDPKILLKHRLIQFSIRGQKLQNVINELDNLETELLTFDSMSSERILEIKNKVWNLYLMIENIIGNDATIAFHMWSDQFEDDPREAVTYPSYILSMFDLPRVEKLIDFYQKALKKLFKD